MGLPLGHNSIDKNEIAKLLKDIKAADDELASLRSAHMTRCKKARKKLVEVNVRAKSLGLDMPGFRTLVAEYRDRRRAESRRDKLEPDEAQALDLYRDAAEHFFEDDRARAIGETPQRRQGGAR